MLGFERSPLGVRPSVDKMAVIRDYQTPHNEKSLAHFLALLPYMREGCPGRADLSHSDEAGNQERRAHDDSGW